MDPARDRRSDEHSTLKRRAAPSRYFDGARKWLRPPRRLRPTRAGWVFFLLTFGIGFAALNTGNNLLYLVLSLMLSRLVLSGVLSESALRGIRIRRRLPPEIFAQRDAHVALEISNEQRRVASLAVVVEDRIAQGHLERPAGRCFALRIAPGSTETRTYRLCAEQRGTLCFRGFVVFTRFPFGLFSKSLLIDAPERTLVYPAVSPVPVPADFGGATDGERAWSSGAGFGPDATGLRTYETGDALRRIHWRASLRAGALLVRELDREDEAEVEVRLRTAGTEPGEGFERLVGWAASEVVALLDAGRRVALRTDRVFHEAAGGSRQRARLLSFLARVEPDPGADLS